MKDNTNQLTHIINSNTDTQKSIGAGEVSHSQTSINGADILRDVYEFVHEKIEKLSMGLYMVTSYMPDGEPVRKSLRVLALSSVGHTAALTGRYIEDKCHELQKDITHILSLLKLSQTLEIMSHMNAEILLSEYQAISDTLTKQKDTKHKRTINVNVRDEASQYNRSEKIELPVRPQNILTQSKHETPEIRVAREREAFQIPLTKKTEQAKRIIQMPENKERRNIRQNNILRVMPQNEPMMIKDITARIKGCSEKTIQRELQELVDTKRIKKIGEKRWSKYIRITS